MAPELLNSIECDELRGIAQKIHAWQESRKMTTAALIKKFALLGSDKTYTRILKGEMKELDLEKQLDNYRSAWSLIESQGEDREEEPIYTDLYAAVQTRRAFAETMREQSIARLVLVQGPTGAGKSSARRALVEQYGSRMFMIEANVAWNDTPMSFMGSALRALGKRTFAYSQVDRLEELLAALNKVRRTMLIEEGHHMGPRCLNLLKTLINNSPGEFGIFAVDKLWKKLESGAYEECKQLTGNRLAERVNLGNEVRESDVQKILSRRIQWAGTDTAPANMVKLASAKANGNALLAFVRETCVRVNDMAHGSPVTPELFTSALSQEEKSR